MNRSDGLKNLSTISWIRGFVFLFGAAFLT